MVSYQKPSHLKNSDDESPAVKASMPGGWARTPEYVPVHTRAQVNPCFRLDIRFPIALPDFFIADDLWQKLSYRIMSEPMDLLAHARRIRLCLHPWLSSRLAGALQDLDHVLDNKGVALRTRLLDESRDVLEPAIFSLFQRHQNLAQRQQGADAFEGSVLPSMAQLLAKREPVTGRLQADSSTRQSFTP